MIITATNNLLALVMSLLCLLKRRHLATVVWRTCTLNGRGLWLVRLAAYRLPLPINATVFFQSFRAENWHRFTVKEEIWRICFAFLTKDSLPPELQAYFFYFLENYNLLWEKLWLDNQDWQFCDHAGEWSEETSASCDKTNLIWQKTCAGTIPNESCRRESRNRFFVGQ